MKNKKRRKSLSKLYGDYIYDTRSMKNSHDTLMSKAEMSLRMSYSHLSDLLAKTFFLAQNGEATRAELRKIHAMANRISYMIEQFKDL